MTAGARRGAPWAVPVLASLVLGVVVLARLLAGPVPATRVPVLLAAAACLLCVGVARARVPGWAAWRRALGGVGLLVLLHPVLWALAVTVTDLAPGGVLQRVVVSLAVVSHLPLLAAFSALPLLATSYLGPGRGRAGGVVVLVLGLLAATAMVLFLGGADPFDLPPLLDWRPGVVVGSWLTTLFVSSVLLGPAVALVSAWRGPAQAARRLSLVAVSALGGSTVVMLCTVVGDGDLGPVALLVGLHAALAVVALGCSTALSTDRVTTAEAVAPPRPEGAPGEPPAPPRAAPAAPPEATAPTGPGARGSVLGLTPRESEVVELLAQGMSNAGIAARLVVSERTVDAHLRSAFTKLDLPEGREANRRVHAVLAWRSRTDEVVPGPPSAAR